MKKLLLLLLILSASLYSQKSETTLKINGRIQYDYEFLSREKTNEKFNGFEFRRVHLSASGKLSSHIKYKIETNFSHANIGFRDVYIQYVTKNIGKFGIGSMAEPTGLDMMTSSKYIPFFERAMLTSLQNFRWGTGLHYSNFKLLNGNLGFQMSLTNNGSNSEGFKDTNLEKGNNFVARISSAPLFNKEKKQVIHLGINYANRPDKDLKFRPENHLGEKYHYVFPLATKRNEYGFEFAGELKNISLQAEYKFRDTDNKNNIDYSISSYYIMGSYFVTGENRPYKHGAFGRVKPYKDIENGGLGAIELLVRYSNMTASEGLSNVNPTLPTQINNITLGLNWYLTSHSRIMYNYVITDDNNSTLGNLKGHLIRAQIDF